MAQKYLSIRRHHLNSTCFTYSCNIIVFNVLEVLGAIINFSVTWDFITKTVFICGSGLPSALSVVNFRI